MALVVVVSRVDAATFGVDTTVDAVDAAPGNGICATAGGACSLRAAIQETNALAGADTVSLPAGTYALTITGQNEQSAARGDLDVAGQLTLTGAGAATTIIDANGLDRAFEIWSPATLSGITLRGGVQNCGGGIRNTADLTLVDAIVTANHAIQGGGICNEQLASTDATLTLGNVTVNGNSATEGGGLVVLTHSPAPFPFILVTATVALGQSVIADNQATNGGGVAVHASGGIARVDATASTIRDNVATAAGGGIYLAEPQIISIFATVSVLHAVDTTISGNEAANGGGVYGPSLTLERSSLHDNVATGGGGGVFGGGTIDDSTISGNRSDGDGGGLLAFAGYRYLLHGVTITDNLADADADGSGDGGGIHAPTEALNGSAYPFVDIRNGIVAGNQDAGGESPDCSGELQSSGHNLLGDPARCLLSGDATGNIAGIGAGLGPLAANGGPTLTHALLPGSPAFDAGAGCSATDQRGVARPQGPSCDIGAVEQVYVAGACGNGTVDGGEACDDGNVRDGDCCNHLCQLALAGAACSDGNPCTDDVCDGAGVCVPSANTAPCSDGSVCTLGPEVCAGGSCVAGPARDCADGNVCTADTCNPASGCQSPSISGPVCDDDNACTASDVCVTGHCVGTPTSAPCDDGNACTDADTCGSGYCTGTPSTAPCDDGDVCTGPDHCDAGACRGGPLPCLGTCEFCAAGVGCVTAPRSDCRLPSQPRGASISLADRLGGQSDTLQWSWKAKGGTTSEDVSSFSIDYELCIFDESAGTPSLVFGARPSSSQCVNGNRKGCWRSIPGGSAFKDATGATNGFTSFQLHAKTSSAKLNVKAKGLNLALPTLPLTKDPGVVVELRRRQGACWTSRFGTASPNTSERFKAKSD